MSTLSCSVFGVKRLFVVLSACVLTSCSVMDVVGPRANGEVMALARQASADEASLAGEPAAQSLRSTHAGELVAEAARLCGTDPAGNLPSSCDVSLDGAELPAGARDAGELVAQVRSHTVAAADKLPPESVDLAVAQAVDTVALEPVDLGGLALGDAPAPDLASARHMLEQEYAFEYGLGLATAWADEPLIARVDALRDASDARRTSLLVALEPTGDVPAPLPGYEVADSASVADSPSAAEFVDRLNADLLTQWRSAAADAEGRQWRDAAIGLAAHAQRA